ncbi:hypothetical protein NKE68_04185 [Streptococcus suis]|uniref:hypothetical protein n=1 Tax=Streptococcus suis TaxID=1307 RepID=UPI00209BB98C|nr:hypothetical protein [Streptococcus suis]MCO8241144.1 hypothetical protein [Streptococcus suis]
MDIKNEKLGYVCPSCNKKIILTFHTIQCPLCHAQYDTDQVKRIFYNYESQVENSKFTQVGNSLQSVGAGLKETGSCLQNLGCFIFGIPFLFILGKLLGLF